MSPSQNVLSRDLLLEQGHRLPPREGHYPLLGHPVVSWALLEVKT